MIRFFIALWAAKIFMFINKLKKEERDDFPGLLANKICPDFMSRIAKPKLVITVTGTNGKTTTSRLVADMLKSKGHKVSHNEWGANLSAGYSLNLTRCVNIFNKVKYDASVLEADELTLDQTMPKIKPNYILVTNISKDSLRRNGHVENIYNHINNALNLLGSHTTAVLNANDPISSNLGKDSKCKKVFFEMADIKSNPFENIEKEILLCPNCYGKLKYEYRHYRHIGKFYCENGDYRTPVSNYYASKLDLQNKNIVVDENGSSYEYPLISETIFNAFNVLSFITLNRELGFSPREINSFLSTQKVTEYRETVVKHNGISYFTYGTKGQGACAPSTVFEYMNKDSSVKNIVMLIDELYNDNHPRESLTWLYETDYEFLKSDNIKKIIVGGKMFLNHRLRLLLAGVSPEKIICVENEDDVVDFVDREGIESVYVLFEIDFVFKALRIRDKIVERARLEN